jgi:hypothetical protein
MTFEKGDPALVPVHAAMDCAAAFVAEGITEGDQQDRSLGLAVLDFDNSPAAAALFGTLLDVPSDDRCLALVEPWIPLAEEEPDAYDAAHAGHPMVRFLIAREHYKEEPIEALSFRVCVQHESGFMRKVTEFAEMGVIGSVPDGVDPDDENLLPPILLVSVDPEHIGYVELRAWRRRYTD